jgi:hypothetical protein
MIHQIKKIIRSFIVESFEENAKNYNVYHIQVLSGGKLNYIAIEKELTKPQADDLTNKLSKDYPSETFFADKESPIQSKFEINEKIKHKN